MLPEPAAPRRGLLDGLLAQTAAAALVVSVIALGAVHHLTRAAADRHPATAGLPDPEVTGSIAGSARSVALDPCTGRERLLVRGPVGRNH